MTLFKRSAELMSQLQAELAEESEETRGGAAAVGAAASIAAMVQRASALGADVAKMVGKAREADPDKQVYGKAMRGKVLQLAADHEALTRQLAARAAQVAPLAEAARAQVAADDAAAQESARQQAALEQQRQADLTAAEAVRKADEERKRKAEAELVAEQERIRRAAEEEQRRAVAAAAEKKKLAESAEREEEAKRFRAGQTGLAAAQHQAKAGAAARAQEETAAGVARQQAADLEERRTSQARAAAAQAAREARGPPRPLLNPEGSLLHLTRGRPELEALLLQAGDRQVVVVDYSAAWCGPCHMMEPVLAGWARELAPRVVFIKADAEAAGNRQLAGGAGIRGYPTFHIYGRGKKVDEMVGADRGGLRAKIDAAARGLAPLEGPRASPAVALANAMSGMKKAVAPPVFLRAAETLLAYVGNLVAYPGDPKFRRIKASNARYRSAVGTQPHGTACMAALGFAPVFEASEEILILDDPSPELPRVKVLLEAAMGGGRGGGPAAGSPAPAPSSAGTAAAARGAALPGAPAAVHQGGARSSETRSPAPPDAGSPSLAAGPGGSASAATPTSASSAPAEVSQDDEENLTEEEQIARAVKMSMEE